MNHDPLCPQQPRDDGTTLIMVNGTPVYCACDLIAKVREDMRQPGRIQVIIDEAYKRGYKEAEEFYTNSCMMCGYAGEWSTYICDNCIERQEND